MAQKGASNLSSRFQLASSRENRLARQSPRAMSRTARTAACAIDLVKDANFKLK
jgi:hypothetical protein